MATDPQNQATMLMLSTFTIAIYYYAVRRVKGTPLRPTYSLSSIISMRVTGAANCLPCSCRHPAPLPRTLEQALMPTYLCISQALSPVNEHKVLHQRQQLAVKVPIQVRCHCYFQIYINFDTTLCNTVLLSTYTHISNPVGSELGHLLSNSDSEWLVQKFHVADWLTELRPYVPLNTKCVISEIFFPANLLA